MLKKSTKHSTKSYFVVVIKSSVVIQNIMVQLLVNQHYVLGTTTINISLAINKYGTTANADLGPDQNTQKSL